MSLCYCTPEGGFKQTPVRRGLDGDGEAEERMEGPAREFVGKAGR
jgi:hypothetical protein